MAVNDPKAPGSETSTNSGATAGSVRVYDQPEKKSSLPIIPILIGLLVLGALAYFLTRNRGAQPVENEAPAISQPAGNGSSMQTGGDGTQSTPPGPGGSTSGGAMGTGAGSGAMGTSGTGSTGSGAMGTGGTTSPPGPGR